MIFDINSHKGIALKDDAGICLTYAELASEIESAAKYTDVNGALCFCLCNNSIGSVIAYLSSLESRTPSVMLDCSKVDELIVPLIEAYNPNYIWAPDGKNIGRGEVVYKTHGFCLWNIAETKHEINPELALLLTTSGSTGSPKLVRLSKKNILANAESIALYLSITVNERAVTSLPMHYSYGLSVINSHLFKGGTVLLTDKSILQRDFWNFVKAEQATSFAGVPYTYEMLKRLRFFNMDLPSLKTLTQAGGKLRPDLVKEFALQSQSVGKRFFVMYGQTEATARMSYLPPEFAVEKCASIGVPIPGGRFSILDNCGNEISENDVEGEIVYSGENVSLGYAENAAGLVKGDENHGTLHTGDIGKRDSDGFYYITGRMKRFVKIWGNRCNLDALEQLLKPIFESIACVGVDDLITVFTTDADSADEIRNYSSRLTGLNVKAFKVKVIEEIPTTSSGKTAYSELQKMI